MSKFKTNDKAEMSDLGGLIALIIVIIAVIGMIVGSLAFFPTYKVWKQEMDGKADLAEAEWSKKIMVEEALAKKDASVYEAEAEVIHAQGVADANKIIGNSLRNNEAYLRYLWIRGLHDGSSEVIYVPTEGNLPILEATRKVQSAAAT